MYLKVVTLLIKVIQFNLDLTLINFRQKPKFNCVEREKKKSNLVRGLNFGPLLHVFQRLKPILNHVEKQKQNITIILYLCVVVFFKCPFQNHLFNQLYILHTLRLYLYVGVFFFIVHFKITYLQ